MGGEGKLEKYKILHIATQAPGHTSGGEIGTLQFSYSLTHLSSETDYIGPKIEDESVKSWYRKVYELERPLNKAEKVWTLLHLYFDRHYLAWKHLKVDYSKYNLIFVEFTKMDYFIQDILATDFRGKIIVRAHNVERDYFKVNYDAKKSLINWLKYSASKKREKYMVTHSDLIFAITEQDKRRLIELYDLNPDKIKICPVGVGLPKNDKHFDGKIGKKLNCLITGSLWFGPNSDATKWFLNEVYPRVADICNLTVAGFKPNDTVKQLCSEKGVSLIDSPESMQPYFESANMVLAPIFDGGGMKVKVAEAMSYGLPVVTTDHGNIGYGLKDHENGFIANTADEFVEAIRDYYGMSEERRCEFLNRAWSTYCEQFSLTSIKNLCEETFRELLA